MTLPPQVLVHNGKVLNFDDGQAKSSFSRYDRLGICFPKSDRLSRLIAVYKSFTQNLTVYLGDEISPPEILELERVTEEFKSSSSNGLFWFRSSGSTGVPKFILHSGESLRKSSLALANVIDFPDDSRLISFFSTNYMSGILNSFFLPWQLGLEIYLAPVFNFSTPRSLGDYCSSERNNLFWGSPNMIKAIALGASPEHLSRVSTVINATGPISPNEVRGFIEKFHDTHLLNTYGSTEQLFLTATTPLLEWEGVGKPIPGVMIQLDSEGLVSIGSETTCLCVLGSGTKLTRPDMLITQDYGRWIEDGNLELLGRRGDVVSLGGVQTDLSELEQRLCEVENVFDCAFELQGTNSWSELTLLVEIDEKGEEKIVDTKLRDLSLKLVGHQVRVVFGAIPRLPNGKIDRRRLGRGAMAQERFRGES